MDGGIHTDSLRITPEILGLVAEIDEFKGAWSALSRILPERLSALRRVAMIESVGSSTRIEGASLSDKEVEALLAGLESKSPAARDERSAIPYNNIGSSRLEVANLASLDEHSATPFPENAPSRLQVTSLASRDEQEVAGYAETMETVFAYWQDISLTENHIRQLHRDLLRYSQKDERHRGEYKKHNNHVEAFGPDGESLGVIFRTASPFDTPRLMTELIDWTRATLKAKDLHPLIAIAVFIVVFLEIHPFQDGNGRLSRILSTLLLLRAGYVYAPYSSLESVIEQNKAEYYRSLRLTQRTIRTDTPDWQPWLGFFLKSLQLQKARLEKKLERERLVLGNLPRLSAQILELCREHGRVTVADAVAVTGANRNTIKDHLKALRQAGHIAQHGAGRGTWYGPG